MRHCGSSKQRLWLGPGRYLRCGWRRHAHADAHCYSDGDRHANCQPYCYGYGYCYLHAATDANTQIGAISKTASHASAKALDFPYRKSPFRGRDQSL